MIKSSRRPSSVRRQAQVLEKISQISMAIALTPEPQELLEKTVQLIWQNFDLYHVQIFLLSSDGHSLRLATAAGEHAAAVLLEDDVLTLETQPSLIALAARTRQGILVRDTSQEPDFRPYHLLPDTRCEIAVPLLAADDLFGVLDIQSEVVNRFDRQELSLLVTLAAQIAVALKNARAMVELNRFATVIDQAADAIMITDLDGRIVYVNPQFEHMTGYSLAEVLGQNPRLLSSQQQDKEFYQQFWQTLLAGQTWKGTFINRRKDGRFYYQASTIFPIKDPQNRIINYAAVLRDITAQINLDQELQAFARQERLLNDILQASLIQTDIQRMLQILADRLGELLEADGCYITRWDEARQVVIPSAAYGELRETYPLIRPEPDEPTLTRLALERQRPIPIPDVRQSNLVSQRVLQLLPSRSLLVFPLMVGEARLGALLISHHEVHHYTPAEIALGERAARLVSLAIFKTLLLEREQRQRRQAEALARQLQTINQMGLEVSGALELEQLLQLVYQRLGELLTFERFILALYQPQPGNLIFRALGDPRAGLLTAQASRAPQLKLNKAPEYLQQVIITGRTVFLPRCQPQECELPLLNEWLQRATPSAAETTDRPVADRENRAPLFPAMHSALGVPLRARNQIIGLIMLMNASPAEYSSDQILLLETIASQIAAAIENILLIESAQRRAQEAEILRQAGATAATTLDLEHTIELILQQLGRVVPYSSAAVHILQGEEEEFHRGKLLYTEIVGNAGFAEPERVMGMRLPLDLQNPLTQVIATRQPRVEFDVQIEFLQFREPPHNHIHGWMGVPLIVQDRLIGAISMDSAEQGAFTEEHAQLATAFANQVAIALDHARQFEDTQRMAIIDALTGLFNRRHFYDLAEAEFSLCQEKGSPISVMMLDLDDFKVINDTYGHPTGDVVLHEVAVVCQNVLRKGDIIGRYGGEEFIVILPETDSLATVQVAERLRQAVAARQIQPLKRDLLPFFITVSIGVATDTINQPAGDQTVYPSTEHKSPAGDYLTGSVRHRLEHLIDHADQALYYSKNTGKNRVSVWGSFPVRSSLGRKRHHEKDHH